MHLHCIWLQIPEYSTCLHQRRLRHGLIPTQTRTVMPCEPLIWYPIYIQLEGQSTALACD